MYHTWIYRSYGAKWGLIIVIRMTSSQVWDNEHSNTQQNEIRWDKGNNAHNLWQVTRRAMIENIIYEDNNEYDRTHHARDFWIRFSYSKINQCAASRQDWQQTWERTKLMKFIVVKSLNGRLTIGWCRYQLADFSEFVD